MSLLLSAPSVYFDNSALGRLTDPAPGVPITREALRRILVEALNVQRIVDGITEQRLVLVSSDILAYEILQAPEWAQDIPLNVLRMAAVVVPASAAIERAAILQANGFRALDALHIGAAYAGGAAYAVSCDERHWLRRADLIRRLLGLGPAIVSPAECVQREGI